MPDSATRKSRVSSPSSKNFPLKDPELQNEVFPTDKSNASSQPVLRISDASHNTQVAEFFFISIKKTHTRPSIMSLVAKGAEEEYSIKPQATTPVLDTSNWPLLLKNYEKRMDYL